MRQAEIQEGGVYVSKGLGVRSGKRVKVIRVIPQTEGPARIEIQDEETGKRTRPLTPSFQASYKVERLPHAVRNLRQAAASTNGAQVGAHPEGEFAAQRVFTARIDVSAELDALFVALSAALDAVGELRKKMS